MLLQHWHVPEHLTASPASQVALQDRFPRFWAVRTTIFLDIECWSVAGGVFVEGLNDAFQWKEEAERRVKGGVVFLDFEGWRDEVCRDDVEVQRSLVREYVQRRHTLTGQMSLPHTGHSVKANLYSPLKPFRLEHLIFDHFHHFKGCLLKHAQYAERDSRRGG